MNWKDESGTRETYMALDWHLPIDFAFGEIDLGINSWPQLGLHAIVGLASASAEKVGVDRIHDPLQPNQ